jgi:hypothetical protein
MAVKVEDMHGDGGECLIGAEQRRAFLADASVLAGTGAATAGVPGY